MADAILKLYVGAVEYGTAGNPISFASANAGEITAHPLNPFYLWNDKGGVQDSVPAKSISIQVKNMWIQDELMAVSDGTASQTYNTVVTPILDTGDVDDLVLKVGTEEWTKVESLVGQSAVAKVYTIDTDGKVTFGDGIQGAIPTIANNITLTYMPDLSSYGKTIYEGLWLEVLSSGVTANPVIVSNEYQITTTTSTLTVSNTTISSVSGVWLQTDPTHAGLNYYSGGSYNANTGVITLGTPVAGANTPVFVDYTYIAIDDLESSYTAIGESTSHTFTNPIPKNNAKLLYFRMNVPATAVPSGGSNFAFRLQIFFQQ